MRAPLFEPLFCVQPPPSSSALCARAPVSSFPPLCCSLPPLILGMTFALLPFLLLIRPPSRDTLVCCDRKVDLFSLSIYPTPLRRLSEGLRVRLGVCREIKRLSRSSLSFTHWRPFYPLTISTHSVSPALSGHETHTRTPMPLRARARARGKKRPRGKCFVCVFHHPPQTHATLFFSMCPAVTNTALGQWIVCVCVLQKSFLSCAAAAPAVLCCARWVCGKCLVFFTSPTAQTTLIG